MLVAHAFYKALMFLGAGSVMHGMHDDTDMKQMGGLRRQMPVTGVTFIVGALALAGVTRRSRVLRQGRRSSRSRATPDTSGCSSSACVGALISALYIGRLVFLTFFGRPRSEEAEHAHESPADHDRSRSCCSPSARERASLLDLHDPTAPFRRSGAGGRADARGRGRSLVRRDRRYRRPVMVAIGLFTTWFVYGSGKIDWLALRVRMQPAQRVLEHGWYVDDYYAALLVTPGKAVAACSRTSSTPGSSTASSTGSEQASGRSRGAADGCRRVWSATYALAFLAGAIGLLVYVGFRL